MLRFFFLFIFIANQSFAATNSAAKIEQKNICKPVTPKTSKLTKKPKQDSQAFVEAEYHTVKKGDTFLKLAKKFGVGIDEIMIANPNLIDTTRIKRGTVLVMPTTHLIPNVKREGIVINLAEMRLYFFKNDNEILTFPISIGAYEKTPLGATKIRFKKVNPDWTPPPSVRKENPALPAIVPPGPDNPLGTHAIYLDSSNNGKFTRIMIHGTNAPWTVGSAVSHGCIRMYPKDIKTLFEKVDVNMPVRIVDRQLKIAEINNKIYLESHLKQLPQERAQNSWVSQYICKKVSDCNERIDWQKVDEVLEKNRGIPVNISTTKLSTL